MTNLIAVSPADVVRASFPFSVDKFPLSGPDNMSTPYYGLFKSDDNECLNSVSSGYYVHTTDDVVALVDAAQAAFNDDVQVSTYWHAGHHVSITPSKKERLAIFGTRDDVFPTMSISAGYNDRPFSAMLSMWRDACRNMMRLQQVNGTRVSIRHTRSLRPRMDELVAVFSGLRDGWRSISQTIVEMEQRKVSLVDFLTAVYPLAPDTTGAALTRHKTMIADIFNRISQERWSTGRPPMQSNIVSAWEAYNGVQGYVFHKNKANGKNASRSDLARFLETERSEAVSKAEAIAVAA